jgi:hypothetical protein
MSYTDSEVLDKCQKWWEYAVSHPSWIEAKQLHLKCFQYREGEQYTAKEKATLEERGQPDTVNNKVAVTINKLMGDFVERKYRIGWRGRNEAADAPLAKLLTDIFRYIRTSNALQFEETDLADDGFTCGFGVMEVFVEFDDLNQPEIKVRSEDSLCVFPDPDWRRYDWNQDARFVARARWFDQDELAERYPKHKDKIKEYKGAPSGSGGGQDSAVDQARGKWYFDENKKQLRVVDMEYKESVHEEIVLIDDPEGVLPFQTKKGDPDYDQIMAAVKLRELSTEVINRVKKKLHRCVFIDGCLLEHKVLRQKYYSLVPYVMYRRKNGAPYSLIALGLSMQDAINKREAKAIHLLNTNQIMYETSAVADPDKLADEMHKPDGLMEFRDGALTQQKVVPRSNIEMAQSQFSMHQAAQSDFDAIVGVHPGAPTTTGELRGSAALDRKFTELGKPVARIFENLTRTRTILGNVLLDFVQLYVSPSKVMLITDDKNQEQLMQLSRESVQKLKTAQYDVVIDDFIDSPTKQQEQWQNFMQVLPQIMPYGPYWIKKLLALSDFPDKNEIIQELGAQNGPPPIEPKLSVQANINELMPEERAFFYKRMGDPELAQLVMQKAPQTTTELKSTVDLAKTKMTVASKEKENEKDDDSDPK